MCSLSAICKATSRHGVSLDIACCNPAAQHAVPICVFPTPKSAAAERGDGQAHIATVRTAFFLATQPSTAFLCYQNLPQLSEVTGKRVHLLLPDEVEYKRAADM